MVMATQTRPWARRVAAEALAQAARGKPCPGRSQPMLAGLQRRDSSLAVAVHRAALQRWITLEHLLNQILRQPISELEPTLRGVLMSAASQILFMDRLPASAVVDESVALARDMVRAGAGGLVNAVLRRLSQCVEPVARDTPWSYGAVGLLPLGDRSVALHGVTLPGPEDFERYLSVVTSHPPFLIRRWQRTLGRGPTIEVCLHGLETPPTIVATEGADGTQSWGAAAQYIGPHALPGFVLWRGSHDDLTSLIDSDPARRVQDPASARPLQSTAGLEPACCIDYCAGRGTKTRQLAAMHPHSRVIATDACPRRLSILRQCFKDHPRVVVAQPSAVGRACGAVGADLLLLDVPCSNTGVLARRPEARYRFSGETLGRLVALQRRIIEASIGFVRPDGNLLYSTCSLEPQENQEQVQWIAARFDAALVSQLLVLPGGAGQAYHDGGYHALLRLTS